MYAPQHLVGICWSCRPSKASGRSDENWPAGVPSRRCTVHRADLHKGRQGTFCLGMPQPGSRVVSPSACDLECMTESSWRQTTGCVELFSLACYILITRVYERILPCMYCITMSVTQNAVCNCKIKLILTYLLKHLIRNDTI